MAIALLSGLLVIAHDHIRFDLPKSDRLLGGFTVTAISDKINTSPAATAAPYRKQLTTQ